ncbi:WD40 repeat-like protein [Ramicandelaber brevisporus]|nr:WD40 repeat-like protein [Ramicandelaber brevisporus]
MLRTQTTPTSRDIEVNGHPSDTVSELQWSPTANYLAASSWDGSVRGWNVDQSGNSTGIFVYEHANKAPALSVHWSYDGQKIASGGADNAARLFDPNTQQSTQVGAHDAPVSCVRFVEGRDAPSGNYILATGSWDKTLKYWDLRQQTPIATYTLPDRCYAMESRFPMLAVATAERHVQIFNLSGPTGRAQPYKTLNPSFRKQISCLGAFPKLDCIALGSIEGRVSIMYLEQTTDGSGDFAYKCHRNEDLTVNAINVLAVNPVHGTFVTCASDGSFVFWDKDARSSLKKFPAQGIPIVSAAYNHTGNIFAYALGYDWGKGYKNRDPNIKERIMLHACTDEETKPKPPMPKTGLQGNRRR